MLPHEKLWLPKYRVIKTSKSNPLWHKFFNWFNRTYSWWWNWSYEYYWYDWSSLYVWDKWGNFIESFINKPALITLKEWGQAINGKTKLPTKSAPKYTKQFIRDDGAIFTETTINNDTIDSIKSRIKERQEANKADQSLLTAHRNLFKNPNK